MKVRIEAGGRTVEIDLGEPKPYVTTRWRDLLRAALVTWQATEGAVHPSEGPAFGLTAQAYTNGRDVTNTGVERGRSVGPVRARG